MRENRTPGSVQGSSGNRCSYCDGFSVLYTLHFLARMLGIQLKQIRSHKAFILFLLFVW